MTDRGTTRGDRADIVCPVSDTPSKLPSFVAWPSFPFEGQLRTKRLDPPVAVEPPREGEDPSTCTACASSDDAYIWVSDRWRVRAMDRPSGLPMVLILESRSHLDLGDLPNLLAAELGVMTVRLERAVRSLDGVERVHVNRWGDGAAHLHVWFLARPTGMLQLRGSFLSLWDDILEPVPENPWRENLALVAAWLADFGGRAIAEPPRIEWTAPSHFDDIGSRSSAPAIGSAPEPPSDVQTALDVESAPYDRSYLASDPISVPNQRGADGPGYEPPTPTTGTARGTASVTTGPVDAGAGASMGGIGWGLSDDEIADSDILSR
jgi:hypothetical protein